MLNKGRFLFLVLLSLALAACHKSQPKIVAPIPAPLPIELPAPAPPPTKQELGEREFLAGNHTRAAALLEAYLLENPGAPDLDKIHFQLGISYALTARTPQEAEQAQSRLKSLVTRFPQSLFRPQAEYILALQSDIEKLRRDILEREKSILAFNRRLLSEDKLLREREAAIRDREEKIKERDEKIRKLSLELDQLKKIDLNRRPSAPPQ